MKKRAKRKQKSRLGTRTKVENVDNLLINKTDRKTINIIFLSALFYPHIKNLNFVTFHNRQMWGVNSNVELGGVNGVKRGKSHHNLTAAQAAISK